MLVNLANRDSTTQSGAEKIITIFQFVQDLYKFRCKYHIKDLNNADVKHNNGVVVVNDMFFERVFIQLQKDHEIPLWTQLLMNGNNNFRISK